MCVGMYIHKEVVKGRSIKEKETEKIRHDLNETQANIINWFKLNSRQDSKRENSFFTELPFTFSFLPNFCSTKDWGSNEYYNCQKFTEVFHKKPENIWKYLETSKSKSRSKSNNSGYNRSRSNSSRSRSNSSRSRSKSRSNSSSSSSRSRSRSKK